MCLADALQRERLSDHGGDAADGRLDQRGAGIAGQVRRGQLHRLDARDGDAGTPGLVAIYLGEPSGRRPVCREPATGDGERERGLTEPAADVVQHDVRHRGLGPGLLRPVRVVAVHDRVGLELPDARQLRGAGEGNDATGSGATELDRHDAEPAAGSDDQEAVCPTDRGDVEQAHCRGPVVEERGRGGQVRVSGTHQSRSVATSARSAYPPSLPVKPATRRPSRALLTSGPNPRHPPETASRARTADASTNSPVLRRTGWLSPPTACAPPGRRPAPGRGRVRGPGARRPRTPPGRRTSSPLPLASLLLPLAGADTAGRAGLNRGSGSSGGRVDRGRRENGWSARGAPPVRSVVRPRQTVPLCGRRLHVAAPSAFLDAAGLDELLEVLQVTLEPGRWMTPSASPAFSRKPSGRGRAAGSPVWCCPRSGGRSPRRPGGCRFTVVHATRSSGCCSVVSGKSNSRETPAIFVTQWVLVGQ